MTVAELRKLLDGKNPDALVQALVVQGQESTVGDFNGMQSQNTEQCLLMVFLPEPQE